MGLWQHTDQDGDRAELVELVNLGEYTGEYRLIIRDVHSASGPSVAVDIPLDDLLRLRDVLDGL